MKKSFSTIISLLLLGSIPSSGAYISVFTGLEGGSGDVDNVLFQNDETGTTLDANLNTSGHDFAVRFTSTTSLAASGGQANLFASGGGTFTDLCFEMLNDATFTKLQLNLDLPNDGKIDGTVTFSVTYIMPDGAFNSVPYDMGWNGGNKFTLLAGDGAKMTKVCWDSDPGVVEAIQYRVGGAALPPSDDDTPGVPDGGTTLAALGLSLLGLGSMRRFLIKKA